MPIINIGHAKAHLSRLIDRAASGEDIVIARNGKPVARLTRLLAGKTPVRFGVLKGKFTVREDFDEPLPEEMLSEFEGR